jgi:hypothetical protein
LLVGLVILVLTAITYGCVGLYCSARLRSTRGAVLVAYAATLLGVAGPPFGLFLLALVSGVISGMNSDRFWPIAWLLNGPNGGGIYFLQQNAAPFANAGRLHIDATVAQVLTATNPLLTGIASAAGLVQGRPTFGVEHVGPVDLLYVAPWLSFGLLHLLAIVLLVWLTGRALRRDAR